MDITPKYSPRTLVNIEVEIIKTIIEHKGDPIGGIVISYQVWNPKEKSYLNSMTVKEESIQD